ncbi:DUF1129 domain-containing protein [Streptococcus massiliensis]|uniref:Putative membrane spanning protein n=1 Tax=Streptococcus massiliensis TaxID=313439 RepID=A0A380KYX9_9STRE|nr:DUF1129 family protein [Streptococcus massiliensis]SUN77214.1 putative membrane spanning protein [Streptococcus massiliensis]
MTYSLDQLTNKNQEFVRIATNQLIKDGKTDQEIQTYLEEIFPEMIENQHKGITARTLYGSPTSWAQSKSETTTIAKEKEENTSPSLMIMDSALFILGIVAAFTGIVNSFSTTGSSYGLVTLLAMGLVGGLAFYAMYHYVYRFYEPGETKRPSFVKSFLIIGGVTLLWVASISLTALLPRTINPLLPGYVILIVGVLVLALRFYLKKRFNIRSAMQTGPRR